MSRLRKGRISPSWFNRSELYQNHINDITVGDSLPTCASSINSMLNYISQLSLSFFLYDSTLCSIEYKVQARISYRGRAQKCSKCRGILCQLGYLKRQCHETFDFWFFMNQFAPSTSVYHYVHFKFFQKFMEIFAAQGSPPVQMEKFNNLVWTPLGCRVSIYINFAFMFTLRYLQPDIVSTTPVANLLPVSLIPVAICHWRC